MKAARQLARWLDELGRISDERGRLTRTFLSPAMGRANALVSRWMREAGLAVRFDAVGNVIGRLDGPDARSKTLLLGSHLDTVRNAGKFDGPLGVLLPVVALAELRRRGVALPFAVEVIGFSEEEGVRFASAYLGSKGYAGLLTTADLNLRDAGGVSVGEAISHGSRGTATAAKLREAARPPRSRDLIGYVEVHIEQGPVLEQAKLAVGVVSAIAGQSRFRLTWSGMAGHAGTTPMNLRRDALAGAAEFVSGVEALARRTPGLVATVGLIEVSGGAANVIPGEVTHTLDVRHARDAVRRDALMRMGRLATRIARNRGLERHWLRTQDNAAVACAPALTAQLARSVEAVQGSCLSLVSGAGHDGVVLSALAPVAMLFVRCRDGLSHHPAEHASPADCDVALRVMVDFIARMAQQHGR
ncbi:MAG: allantoate amidohydrolase [Opitutaceae bacterium]|nr:allantoate amidohydrolase [Opitutaceae bacterium]